MPSPVHPYSDYGVALRTLRSARSWLGFLLVVCVLFQFVGFALMAWTSQPYKSMHPERIIGPTSMPMERNFVPASVESRRLNIRDQWNATYTMCVPVTQIAALISVSSQAIIMFITLLVVLVAQAPGVTQLTKSLIWSVLLLFMFLPWQYFAKDFPIPGVIYGYTELLQRVGDVVAPDNGHFANPYQHLVLYLRFVAWPLIGLLALLITSERFRAGIMLAIGHPLQSMLQPRSITPPPFSPPLPIMGPEKRIP
ncbi:MAG: hypothetical protein FWD61_11135 [Phycisphaerales bacterium]|nr:hypothetical protein [Phycisphaerales bacterium]